MKTELTGQAQEQPTIPLPQSPLVQQMSTSSSYASMTYGIATADAASPSGPHEAVWRAAVRYYLQRFILPALDAVGSSLIAALKVVAFLATLWGIYMLALALTAVRPARPSSRLARLSARTRYALWQLEQQLPDGDRAQAS